MTTKGWIFVSIIPILLCSCNTNLSPPTGPELASADYGAPLAPKAAQALVRDDLFRRLGNEEFRTLLLDKAEAGWMRIAGLFKGSTLRFGYIVQAQYSNGAKKHIFLLRNGIIDHEFVPAFENKVLYGKNPIAVARRTVGMLSFEVPQNWTLFADSEALSLRRQYEEQSQAIYRQFAAASTDPTNLIDILPLHVGDSTLVVVAARVPPKGNVISFLQGQVPQKMDWGTRQGYIQKYLGMSEVGYHHLGGFETTAIGKDGNLEISGVYSPQLDPDETVTDSLGRETLKSTIFQITFLASHAWNEDAKELFWRFCADAMIKGAVKQ